MQRAELDELKSFVALVEQAGGMERMKAAARAAGLPFRSWVMESLLRATQSNNQISIASRIHERLKGLAYGRNVTLDVLTQGRHFTEVVENGLDNQFI